MATYEVLEPGGHARLVSDVKGYANRASGVGTTQIADESVTSAKLADDVTDTLDSIESFTDPMNKNGLHGELAEGALLTADDVYAAPPKGVDVFGVSTQSGTPTPDAPVEIKSVDDLTLVLCGKNLLNPANFIRAWFYASDTAIKSDGTSIYAPVVGGTSYTMSGGNGNRRTVAFTTELPAVGVAIFNGNSPSGTSTPYTFTAPPNAKYMVAYIDSTSTLTPSGYQLELGSTDTAYEPYVGASVPIDLGNYELRSLLPSLRDELHLTYLGPSEQDGYARYSKTLVEGTARVSMSDLTWSRRTGTSSTVYDHPVFEASLVLGNYSWTQSTPRCNALRFDGVHSEAQWGAGNYDGGFGRCSNRSNALAVRMDSIETLEDFVAWVESVDAEVVCNLETPVTHDLGEVELPVMPSEHATVWCDGGSAQPTLRMGYERDVNIVISNMMSVIADAATS